MRTDFTTLSTQGAEDDLRPWRVAGEHIRKLERISPLFTTPIRALMVDAGAGRSTTNLASQYLVMRLLKSPTFKAIFYYSAMTFRAEQIASAAYLSSYDLVRLYQPLDLAALLAIVFTYRKVKALLNNDPGRLDLAEFSKITTRIEIAGHLGTAIPNLGCSNCLLSSSLPLFSHAIMSSSDLAPLRAYKKHLASKKKLFDLEYEQKQWGTTCLHVSATLLQKLGFGAQYPSYFFEDMQHCVVPYQSQERDKTDRDGGKNSMLFSIIELWMNTLLETGQAPTTTIPGAYYPLQKDLYRLLYHINSITEAGSKHDWLTKGRTDISPHTTPQLYQEVLSDLMQTEDVRKFMSENLPEALVNSMSDEELAEIARGRVDADEL
ncbi:MAG: hypothetical protein K1X79_05450 [Oligoflexia bacterium]|nr:hypothetical protein [Oligoflexia bacterium]